MPDYNHLINSHFSSCRLLANARDNHRNRDVRLYAIPGNFEFVGVTDGTDSWVAPTSINPFSANVQRLLEDMRAGKPIEVNQLPSKHERRKIVLTAPDSTPPQKRTRHVIKIA